MCASWECVLSLAIARSEDMELQQGHLCQPTGFSSTVSTFSGDVYNFLDLEKCSYVANLLFPTSHKQEINY